MKDIAQKLEKLILNAPCWAEARYHKRKTQSIGVQKGLVKQLKSSVTSGVGIRVLVNGTWGFSSTSDLTDTALEKTLKQAINCAKNLSALKKKNVQKLDTTGLKKGEFILGGYKELEQMPFQQKLEQVIKAENQVRTSSNTLETASCAYNEIFEDKIVVTTDGANAHSQLARNEIKLSAVASQKGDKAEGHMTSGKTGNWQCLFQENSFDSLTQDTAKLAIDLLTAPSIPGGLSTIILSPKYLIRIKRIFYL
jgi:TldD protein